MIAVADSSALITLAVCGSLNLIDQLFMEIRVPQSVYNEVIVKGKPEAASLQAYLSGKTVPVDLDKVVVTIGSLGRGELEAMALYKTLHADYLLIDDKRARKVAKLNNINITGSHGILLLAKHKGLISHVKPFLDRLLASDIYISELIIKKTLPLANESG